MLLTYVLVMKVKFLLEVVILVKRLILFKLLKFLNLIQLSKFDHFVEGFIIVIFVDIAEAVEDV